MTAIRFADLDAFRPTLSSGGVACGGRTRPQQPQQPQQRTGKHPKPAATPPTAAQKQQAQTLASDLNDRPKATNRAVCDVSLAANLPRMAQVCPRNANLSPAPLSGRRTPGATALHGEETIEESRKPERPPSAFQRRRRRPRTALSVRSEPISCARQQRQLGVALLDRISSLTAPNARSEFQKAAEGAQDTQHATSSGSAAARNSGISRPQSAGATYGSACASPPHRQPSICAAVQSSASVPGFSIDITAPEFFPMPCSPEDRLSAFGPGARSDGALAVAKARDVRPAEQTSEVSVQEYQGEEAGQAQQNSEIEREVSGGAVPIDWFAEADAAARERADAAAHLACIKATAAIAAGEALRSGCLMSTMAEDGDALMSFELRQPERDCEASAAAAISELREQCRSLETQLTELFGAATEKRRRLESLRCALAADTALFGRRRDLHERLSGRVRQLSEDRRRTELECLRQQREHEALTHVLSRTNGERAELETAARRTGVQMRALEPRLEAAKHAHSDLVAGVGTQLSQMETWLERVAANRRWYEKRLSERRRVWEEGRLMAADVTDKGASRLEELRAEHRVRLAARCAPSGALELKWATALVTLRKYLLRLEALKEDSVSALAVVPEISNDRGGREETGAAPVSAVRQWLQAVGILGAVCHHSFFSPSQAGGDVSADRANVRLPAEAAVSWCKTMHATVTALHRANFAAAAASGDVVMAMAAVLETALVMRRARLKDAARSSAGAAMQRLERAEES